MAAMIDRRSLISAAIGTAALSSVRGWAAPAGAPRLMVLFLRGAYDCCSLLVPRGSSFYYEARPSLAVRSDQMVPLDGDWGLTNAVAPALQPLWAAKQLAFVPFAGTPDLSRSHFETQESMELGLAAVPRERNGAGFMNRLAAELGNARPMAFGAQLPVAMRGPLAVPNINMAGRPGGSDPKRAAALAGMYANDAQLGGQVAASLAANADVSDALKREMVMAGQGAMSASGFDAAAVRMAAVMKDKINLAMADVGGWDTHVNQNGTLAFHMGVLSKGLAAFARTMGPEWANTVVVVVSEFGRTFRENGNRGTDHGHGTSYLLLGGAVKGGRIAGEQARLTAATLNQGRDLPVLNDYRAVLGGLFQRLYGLKPAQVARIFPGMAARDLALV